MAHFVDENKIKAKMDDSGKYVSVNFLKKHAIQKDSSEAESLSDKYFEGKDLTDILHTKWSIDDTNYQFESYGDRSNKHTTYYCFVKIE